MTYSVVSASDVDRSLNDYRRVIEASTGKECIILLVEKIDRLLALLSQEDIARVVEFHKSPKLPGLKSHSRKRELVNLRKVYCILAQRAGYHLREMGWFLGGRDHTTILHNIVHGKHHLETEPDFQELFNRVQSHLLELYENRLNGGGDVGLDA